MKCFHASVGNRAVGRSAGGRRVAQLVLQPVAQLVMLLSRVPTLLGLLGLFGLLGLLVQPLQAAEGVGAVLATNPALASNPTLAAGSYGLMDSDWSPPNAHGNRQASRTGSLMDVDWSPPTARILLMPDGSADGGDEDDEGQSGDGADADGGSEAPLMDSDWSPPSS